jgi:predicted RNA methylase
MAKTNTSPGYCGASGVILCGDSLEVLKTLEANSVDSVVTDPPYGLSFMGKHWDYDVPQVELWREVYRVLKPGGHLLSFAGTRTQHRMAVNIEDTGFEIRDMIAWVYGSGFPKSLNIGKKLEGWEGWGTALKPALEPITVARKPLEGTVANNVLKYGTGGLNIDGSRVGSNPGYKYNADSNGTTFHGKQGERAKQTAQKKGSETIESTQGRFPANLIHDGSDEVVGLFPDARSNGNKSNNKSGHQNAYVGGELVKTIDSSMYSDSGSAARFFYCAKASKSERNKGLEGFEDRVGGGLQGTQDGPMLTGSGNERNNIMKNHHPTVKPVKLMQYLVKLVTPKGGTVLDPFTGSGTTGIACKLEGFEFVGIEREQEYVDIANARIEAWQPDKQMGIIK